MVLKAVTAFSTSRTLNQLANEWVERRQLLEDEGVRTPTLYFAGRALLVEEYVGEKLATWLQRNPGGSRQLIDQVFRGHRDVEAVPQPVDDRTDHGPLVLQGVGHRHVELEAQGDDVHDGTGPAAAARSAGSPAPEGLDDVARLEVLVVLEPDTALEAGLDLADVLLEPAQRRDRRPSR